MLRRDREAEGEANCYLHCCCCCCCLWPLSLFGATGLDIGVSLKSANEFHEPRNESGPLRLQASQESWRVKYVPPSSPHLLLPYGKWWWE